MGEKNSSSAEEQLSTSIDQQLTCDEPLSNDAAITSTGVNEATTAILSTEEITGFDEAVSTKEFLKDQFVDTAIRTLLGPFGFVYDFLPAEKKSEISSAYKNYLTNLSSFTLGFADALQLYANSDEGRTIAGRLFDLHLELSTPDDDGIFLLRKSFLLGLYEGLDEAVGDAMKLANGLADYLALPSVKNKVNTQVKQTTLFLFGDQSETFGTHAELSYTIGFQIGKSTTNSFKDTISDKRKTARALGKTLSGIASEIAFEKGIFNVFEIAITVGKSAKILRYKQWTSIKPAPGIDSETRKLVDRLEDITSAAAFIRTGGTGGIKKFRVREETVRRNGVSGKAIEVFYSGQLLPGMPRSKKAAIAKALKTKRTPPPIAPGYNSKKPANLLKQLLFVDAEGKPNLVGSWERAHTYGPGWGDEGGAGIWLAPKKMNQVMQNVLAENFGRKLRTAADKAGGAATIDISSRAFPAELLPNSYQTELTKHPLGAFLMDVQYNYKVVNKQGDRAELSIRIELDPPPEGNVKLISIEKGDLDNDFNKQMLEELQPFIEQATSRLNALK